MPSARKTAAPAPAKASAPARASSRAGAPARAANGTAPALSRERIFAATLALIDRDGVAAFSLRELAKVLGVYPTAVYWYVPNRNELIAGAVALALADVSRQLRTGSWQDKLRSLFHGYRSALHAHPRIAPIVGGELVSNGPLDLPMLEYVVGALEEAGYDGPAMVDAYNVTVAALFGFVTMELASAPAQDAEAWGQAHAEEVAAIPTSDYPALSRHIGRLSNRAFILRWSSGTQQPMDRSFEAWVDVVLAGLQARAQYKPAAARPVRSRGPAG